MRNSSSKHLPIAGLLLASAGLATTASAHEIIGSLSNGVLSQTGAGATDVYTVSCYNDPTLSSNPTDHLYFQVRDASSAGGQISATAINNAIIANQVTNNLRTAVTATDLVGGDNSASAVKTLKTPVPAQDVTFTVVVHHTAAATDNYVLTAHCEDAGNNHTGTDSLQLQNQ
ncbi:MULTISPECIES: hypothetical protein [Methylomonas]|uniref:Uncharacterized protein n=1 Tax=Methylomonas koyamae TaxID=702114 RepID=A0A291IFU4_9GAMM|nr:MULTISPECIES: hypothetical protein [Methylomonas]ATG89086.1 hypothetical protein MKLM6_0812 [Methylomonas koyamae]OAI29477.1 hypothetical protein A1356_03860 [Methylomonas koyamae]WNB76742.1 hypothetical protein RI210_03970 [Methylomonas koyamae]